MNNNYAFFPLYLITNNREINISVTRKSNQSNKLIITGIQQGTIIFVPIRFVIYKSLQEQLRFFSGRIKNYFSSRRRVMRTLSVRTVGIVLKTHELVVHSACLLLACQHVTRTRIFGRVSKFRKKKSMSTLFSLVRTR